MSDETLLREWRIEYEMRRDDGESVTPEDLVPPGRPHLLQELRLRVERRQRLLLMAAPVGVATSVEEPSTLLDKPGRPSAASARHGRFTVLRPHKSGGMGEVLIAEDTELHRQVALKRIRSEFRDYTHYQHRFLREAEITSRLEHPGVVPVLGLVYDDTGSPCYVMRYIEGQTLASAIEVLHTKPAGNSRGVLASTEPFRQLLQHFIAVCKTIAYAHSRGIIHRDLKPQNIILGQFGETYVLDWGLAKDVKKPEEPSPAQGVGPLAGTTAPEELTRAGGGMGTRGYMSPEQAAGDWHSVGFAADVYSLGAVLFSILTCKSPAETNHAQPVPSAADVAAALRSAEAPRPLTALCLKAMSKPPGERYAAAGDLAQDAERWLADEAVSALKDSRAVRARRWARKHRTLVTSAGLVLVVTSIGLAVTTVLLGRAYEDEAAQRLVATEAKADTDVAFRFLAEDVLAASRAKGYPGGLGTNVTVREALDAAAPKIEKTFAGRPLAEAKTRLTLGDTYWYQGEFAKAIHELQLARTLFLKWLGPEHHETLLCTNSLATAFRDGGQSAEAVPLYEEALKLLREQLGAAHEETLDVSNNLAEAYQNLDRMEDALPLFEETLRLREEHLGQTHPDTLLSLSNLANAYFEAERLAEALPLLERVRELNLKHLGFAHPNTLTSLNNLARAFQQSGRMSESVPLLEDTLRMSEEILGPKHAETLIVRHNLAFSYHYSGRLRDALPHYETVLQYRKEVLGPKHEATLNSMNTLGVAYHADGRWSEALHLLEATLTLRKETLGPKSGDTLGTMLRLARLQSDRKAYQAAEDLFLECYAALEEGNGPTGQRIGVIERLVYFYDAWGKPAKAQEWLAKLPPRPRAICALHRHLAWSLVWGWPRL